MGSSKYQFLEGILGNDGAQALYKAAERQEVFDGAIIPRAILSWLNVADSFEYDDTLPGVENVHIQLKKSGDCFTGCIGLDGDLYTFENASQTRVAAHIAVALGINVDAVPVNDPSLKNLGKSLDMLAKAHMLRGLQKALADVKPGTMEKRKLAIVEKTPPQGVGKMKSPAIDIPQVKSQEARIFDYSHLLPEQVKDLLQLRVIHTPWTAGDTFDGYHKTELTSLLIDKSTGKPLSGCGTGYVDSKEKSIETHLDPIPVAFRGRGLGKALHTAVLAHAYNALGIRNHMGGALTPEGLRTVASVAKEHGIDFKATPLPIEEQYPHYAGMIPRFRGNDRVLKSGDLTKAAPTGAAGRPGPQHMIEQAQPNTPQAPIPTQPKQPRKPEPQPPVPKALPVPPLPPLKSKIPTGRGIRMKLSLSEASNRCGMCGRAQFKEGRFTGCLCLSELAKHADVATTMNGYILNLHPQHWDEEAVATLNAALRNI